MADEVTFLKGIRKLYLDRNTDITKISPWTRHNMCSLVESIEKSGGSILNVPDYPEVVGDSAVYITLGEGGTGCKYLFMT